MAVIEAFDDRYTGGVTDGKKIRSCVVFSLYHGEEAVGTSVVVETCQFSMRNRPLKSLDYWQLMARFPQESHISMDHHDPASMLRCRLNSALSSHLCARSRRRSASRITSARRRGAYVTSGGASGADCGGTETSGDGVHPRASVSA